MAWINREGTSSEQRLKELQEELSLENLVGNKIADAMPDVSKIKDGSVQLVNDSGSLYLVTKHNGQIKKALFT